MTVCSERHAAFWLRAGAEPASLVVTGQPRFDFYLRPDSWPFPRDGEPTVLFLSYAVDAYHPGEGTGGDPWQLLHRQTEAGLHELARQGWRVLIKPHPQQSSEHVRAWRERAGDLWGRQVLLVDSGADVRKLIVTADVVVGFQTTALLEAMLVGRPTVYTGWDRRAIEMSRDLIPFHEWHREIAVPSGPGELVTAVAALRGQQFEGDVLRRRRAIAERYLGPLDGGASDRVLSILVAEAAAWEGRRGATETELRQRLMARRPPLRLSRRTRAGVRTTRRRVGEMLGR
jgi:hypothetical protein